MAPKRQDNPRTYWEQAYRTFYEAYYQELVAEALISFWQRTEVVTTFVVAAAASGSAVSGWALWSRPGFWRSAWTILAGLASVLSITQGILGIPRRLKELEDLRRHFSQLRVDAQSFQQRLEVGLASSRAEAQFNQLRGRLAESVGRVGRDLALTDRLRNRVQDQLDERMKQQGDHDVA